MPSFFLKGTAPSAINPYQGPTSTPGAPTTSPAQSVDRQNCEDRCYDRYHNLLADANVDNAAAGDTLQECLARCYDNDDGGGGGGGEEPPIGGGCPGGYKAKTVGGRQLSPCQQGYLPQNINGESWCCPEKSEKTELCAGGHMINAEAQCPEGFNEKLDTSGNKWCCPGDEVEPPIEGECKCEGGKKVGTFGFTMGKGAGGAIWDDPNKVLPPRFIRSADWEGHVVWDPETQKFYKVPELHDYYQKGGQFPTGFDSACPKGWTMEGDCCCPGGGGDDGGGGLGEFKWPGEIMDLWGLLAGRGKEILTKEPGYSQGAIDQMFGKEFENIRSLGGAARDQETSRLQSEGLLGTGASKAVGQEQAWESERRVGDVIRDLFVLGEEKRKQDLLDYSSAGSDIIGAGRGLFGEQEAFNVGRRGESMGYIALLLQYLQSLMESYGR